MTSEQSPELIRGHADDGKDVPQSALRHVLAGMDRNWDSTSVGVPHHMMAALDALDGKADALKRLDYVRSRYGRDRTRHKTGSYQKSGYVECHGQLIGWSDHIQQRLKRGAQVGDCLFRRRPISDRAHTGPDQGGSTPDAVLILLDDVGHVHDTSHFYIMPLFAETLRAHVGKVSKGRLGTSCVAFEVRSTPTSEGN
jgi:hypothetical protein